MKSVSLILFDFDGTISDSHEAMIETFNSMSDQFGFRKVERELLPELKNKTTRELLTFLRVPMIRLPAVMKEARRRFFDRLPELRPFSGIEESMKSLKAEGYQLGILTSNARNTVESFLDKNDLQIFEFVHSEASIFGKARVLKSVIKKRKMAVDQVVYVGDETRDIEAAKRAGIAVISVTWGFNSKAALSGLAPDFLIDHPSELLEIFKSE